MVVELLPNQYEDTVLLNTDIEDLYEEFLNNQYEECMNIYYSEISQ